MAFVACIVAAVLFPIVLAGPSAAAQDDRSLGIELSIQVLAEDPDVRRAAVEALRRMGPAAVPALIQGLADADPEVRYAAAAALGEIWSAAEPAVPALIPVLADVHPDVRRAAAWALGEIGSAAEPALTRVLSDAAP